MRDSILHRGPDDAGLFLKNNVGLGSRRLSILDLSENGHMPMNTPDGRYWIAYNGEVYNFGDLRNFLVSKGFVFRSNSDTEVLLYLYQLEGPKMLDRCNGMFAIAIWDEKENSLFLARDRMGVKPLFYLSTTKGFFFASEEKAIFSIGFNPAFNESTVSELLLFRYVSGENTPYQNVKRLLPGHYLLYRDGNLSITRWYNLSHKIDPFPVNRSLTKASEEFLELFDDSIRLRRISDVPVGTLLSGGLDSGSMTATMASQAGSGISTYTVKFTEHEYDESSYAKELANRWGLGYHELTLAEVELPDMLNTATFFLDEPLVHGHDPHLLAISKLAKENVTVLLSGEGADEIMGGYVRYLLFRYPGWLINALGSGSGLLSKIPLLPHRMHKAGKILNFNSIEDKLVNSSADIHPSEIGLGKLPELEYRYSVIDEAKKAYKDPVRQMMYYEQHTYLQSLNDRNDRMTMGASIECREPFLDYRLVEWSANLPTQTLFNHGVGKAIMRNAMLPRLPNSILDHKKWGFGVPWNKYFRNEPYFCDFIKKLSMGNIKTRLPINSQIIDGARSYINGNDSLLPLVRQYIFFDIWQKVCLQD